MDVEQVGGDEPPPRLSVRSGAGVREHRVCFSVPVGGGRSPRSFAVIPMNIAAFQTVFTSRTQSGAEAEVIVSGGMKVGESWQFEIPFS